MDFSLDPDQQAMLDTARRFARDRLAPAYAEREAQARLGSDLMLEMGRLGLIGADLPERHGGLGLDALTAGLMLEKVAEGDFNAAYLPLLASLCGQIIAGHARPEIAEEWLGRICRGQSIVALALTEPGSGSDAAALRLTMRRDADTYVLDGEKTSISCADQSAAAIVFGRLDGAKGASAGAISAMLVPLDLPGITRSRFDDLGQRAIGRGTIYFESVRVPTENLLGAEGEGFRQVMQGFDYSRALIGLQCLAVASVSLRETWTYARERRAFGKPLTAFQSVSHRLAELETQLEAARLLCCKTLWLKANGHPHAAEAAMCKWWAPKLAFETVHACLLFHGHSGYAAGLPFEQRLRDVLGLQIGDGTAEIMKTIIARARVGREAVPA